MGCGRRVRGHIHVLVVLLLVCSCDTRAANVRVVEVVGPTGGDALTVVSMGSDVVVPTEFGAFVSTTEQWHAQAGLGLASPDPGAAMSALVRDGAQMNYPRSSLIARHHNHLWMVSRIDGDIAVLKSDSLGERWDMVPVPMLHPDVEPTGEEELATPAIRAAEPPRLVTGLRRLYLVGTTNVWTLDGDEEHVWTSIGLDGLPVASEGLPPAIRNYLPRSGDRPFEMMTVLADQLLVYRRSELQDPWVLTSTMAVVDRELLGVTGSDAVFLISPDSIQRTDDQGERWFRFWPEGYPRIEAFALLAPSETERPFDMVVGAVDGSIWRSEDAGATWSRSRPADPDRRSITGLARHGNGLWASTLGEGVMFSADRGRTWAPRNLGLRAARPLDVAFTNDGDVLLASRAGLVQLSGEPDSGNWTIIDQRATSAVSVNPISDRTVSGTVRGDLATRAEEGEPVLIEIPFGKEPAFEFSPQQVPRFALPPAAVVSINARDDGRRWLAWSRSRGGVKSDDGGNQWSVLKLSEGLTAALASTTVRQVMAEASETIYLLEENRDSRAPALLWRSEDDGSSWTTIHAFPRERAAHVLIRARPPNYPGVLFAAHGDQFTRSNDSGATWTQIDGPWRGNRIIGLAMLENRAALLLDARRRLEVVVVQGLDGTTAISRHTVIPPDNAVIDPEDVARFELFDRRILIVGKQRMWTGALPERRRALGDGLAFLMTFAGSILLILVAFALMRATPAK